MGYQRYAVSRLEDLAFALAGADKECLQPIITYLRQGRTAAEAQQLQNALDLRAVLKRVQNEILHSHPERRDG